MHSTPTEIGSPRRKKGKLVLIGLLTLCLIVAFVFVSQPTSVRAQILRIKHTFGFAKLERVYTHGQGTARPVFSPDPSRQVEWIEANKKEGWRIGDGPSGSGSSTYHGGGIVGFSDGSELGFTSPLSYSSDGQGNESIGPSY